MSLKHNIKRIRIGRSFNQRKALLRQLLNDLIEHGSITTTLTKAKWLKNRFDKLCSRAKIDSLHSIRLISGRLSHSKNALKLVKDIAPKLSGNSGFTRLKRIKIRSGDAATMVKLEIILPKAAVIDKKNALKTKINKTKK